MRKPVFAGMFTLAVLLGCTPQKETKSPVEGAWQVVFWERFANDTLNFRLGMNFTGTEVKIWSKACFNFVGFYNLMDTATYDNYGGGTYKLEGNHYEESYQYFSEKSMVGTTQRLLLEISNDTLTQTWPCDDSWQVDKANYNIQKLVRKD